MRMPNKPDATNPAIALLIHVGLHWRVVADPERSVEEKYGIARHTGLTPEDL